MRFAGFLCSNFVQLSPEDIKSFQQLYKKELGIDIDEAKAIREANRLLALIAFASESVPPELQKDYEKFKEQNARE